MVPIRWLLGFIQSTKESTRMHDVIFTYGLKAHNDLVCRALIEGGGVLNQDSHLSHSVMSLGVLCVLIFDKIALQWMKPYMYY